LVVEADIAPELRARIFRDGLIAYEFSGTRAPPALGAEPDGFEVMADYQVRCVRLMNAHLACLVTTSRQGHRPTVVVPEDLLVVDFDSGKFQSGSGQSLGADLGMLRLLPVDWMDWRIRKRYLSAIPAEGVRESFSLLTRLLDRPHADAALLHAELLYRAAAAYGDHDHPGALVQAWTAIEGLMRYRLEGYLDEVADRPIDRPGKFINADRKSRLVGSRFTAELTVELLSLADRVPFSVYSAVRDAAKARNDWLHNQTAVSAGRAAKAIMAAQTLFSLVEGESLEMPLGRQLGSLG